MTDKMSRMKGFNFVDGSHTNRYNVDSKITNAS